MSKLILALGSNLGDREKNLNNAIALITRKIGDIEKTSSFHKTAPVEMVSENYFLNAVILVKTKLSVYQAFKQTQRIEKILGRKQKSQNGVHFDRTIDIDVLFYNNLKIRTKRLTLPHPKIQFRDFVLIPLKEICTDYLISDYLISRFQIPKFRLPKIFEFLNF
ncbi:MAG: 2-amino-4-hydroxy-6-hydroxymethyldihydropteridine diphosphokinase [Prevotellaceae bacterium]|jgi:2-amino-4-hydroxy-6-hydroxymethyldihydropteridine diphosphokinase|nr:2-amino-4-hydroxy-6-hydroxymethyldihydropteridine diphosphokinase [Prevotellaceae bacterium]